MSLNGKNTFIKIAFIIFAGFMDFAMNFMFNIVLKVPLFLDTTFMIAVLFIFGPVESFFAYIVNMLCTALRLYILYGSTEYIYLYSLSAITIILVTWLSIKHFSLKSSQGLSVNQRFVRFLLTAIVAALACSVVSGFISYFTFQNNSDDWAFDKIIFSLSSVTGENMLKTFIIGRIPIIVLDRIITTFAGYGVYLLWKKNVNEK